MIYNLYIVKGLVQSDIIAIAYGHDVSHVDITPPYIYMLLIRHWRAKQGQIAIVLQRLMLWAILFKGLFIVQRCRLG